MDENIKPIPPAPELCRMGLTNSDLVLGIGTWHASTIATAHNEDLARRMAACWNACIGVPTSVLEATVRIVPAPEVSS